MAVSFGRNRWFAGRFELAGLLRDLSFSSRSASRDLSSAAQKMPPFAQIGRAVQPFARIDPPC
jgi:hypothetical protein